VADGGGETQPAFHREIVRGEIRIDPAAFSILLFGAIAVIILSRRLILPLDYTIPCKDRVTMDSLPCR
jgi:hypothetical protein